MSNPVDARRRWFGLCFLFIAIGMVIWGQTLLKPYLNGLLFIFYWLVCFAFTMLALLTALLDLWIVRLRMRQAHRDLVEKTWQDIDRNSQTPESGTDKEKNQGNSRLSPGDTD